MSLQPLSSWCVGQIPLGSYTLVTELGSAVICVRKTEPGTTLATQREQEESRDSPGHRVDIEESHLISLSGVKGRRISSSLFSPISFWVRRQKGSQRNKE